MKKRWSLWYFFGVILFLAWIGFVFFEAKKDDLISPILKEQTTERNADSPLYSDFLTGEKKVSLNDLETLETLKDKIELLEQDFQQQTNKKNAELLITSYLLDNQFDKAKKIYLSLSSEIQNQLPADTAFKIWINTFSQTSDKEYQQVKNLLEQLYQQKVFSELEKNYYSIVFDLVELRFDEAKSKLKLLKGSQYESFWKAIASAFSQYQSLKDVPEYYQEGLL